MITVKTYYNNHILCSTLHINQGQSQVGRIVGSKDWLGNPEWSVYLPNSKKHFFRCYETALRWARKEVWAI